MVSAPFRNAPRITWRAPASASMAAEISPVMRAALAGVAILGRPTAGGLPSAMAAIGANSVAGGQIRTPQSGSGWAAIKARSSFQIGAQAVHLPITGGKFCKASVVLLLFATGIRGGPTRMQSTLGAGRVHAFGQRFRHHRTLIDSPQPQASVTLGLRKLEGAFQQPGFIVNLLCPEQEHLRHGGDQHGVRRPARSPLHVRQHPARFFPSCIPYPRSPPFLTPTRRPLAPSRSIRRLICRTAAGGHRHRRFAGNAKNMVSPFFLFSAVGPGCP